MIDCDRFRLTRLAKGSLWSSWDLVVLMVFRQKKLAETQKLETMYSSLFDKFNDEETVFEEPLEPSILGLFSQTKRLGPLGPQPI